MTPKVIQRSTGLPLPPQALEQVCFSLSFRALEDSGRCGTTLKSFERCYCCSGGLEDRAWKQKRLSWSLKIKWILMDTHDIKWSIWRIVIRLSRQVKTGSFIRGTYEIEGKCFFQLCYVLSPWIAEKTVCLRERIFEGKDQMEFSLLGFGLA